MVFPTWSYFQINVGRNLGRIFHELSSNINSSHSDQYVSVNTAFKNDHLLCKIPLHNCKMLFSSKKITVNSSKPYSKTIPVIINIWIL